MNAAVGPRKVKVSARERSSHNTAIAIAVLLSCAAPLAWSQNDKPAGSSTTPAATGSKPGSANATAPASSGSATGTATGAKKPAAGATGAGAAGAKAPGGEKAQASYSLGVSMGDQLHHLGLTAESISSERLTQGLKDALAGKVAMSPADQQNIQNFVKTARNNMAET